MRTARRGAALAALSTIGMASMSLAGCSGEDEPTSESAPSEEAPSEEPASEEAPSEEAPEGEGQTKETPPADDDLDVISAWSTTASNRDEGTEFTFTCPPGGTLDPSVWGGDDGQCTDDSSICVAAVHAGLITTEDGGTVTVARTPGLEPYGSGFESNGVTSGDWDQPWSRSFTFPDA